MAIPSAIGFFMVRLSKLLPALGFGRPAMRDASFGRGRRFLFSVLIGWAILASGLPIVPGRIFAADAADSASLSVASAASKTITQGLRNILDGTPPSGVTDLRAMQGHGQQLAAQLRKCT